MRKLTGTIYFIGCILGFIFLVYSIIDRFLNRFEYVDSFWILITIFTFIWIYCSIYYLNFTKFWISFNPYNPIIRLSLENEIIELKIEQKGLKERLESLEGI